MDEGTKPAQNGSPGDANDPRNGLSCEVCRRKKIKCDRKLPACTTCAAGKYECQYREAKQRGPQVGYISVLESRLATTEIALFEALSKLHGFGDSSDQVLRQGNEARQLQERYHNMPYTAKTSEWAQQPLQSLDDQRRWWLERQHVLTEAEQGRRGSVSKRSPPSFDYAGGRERRTSSLASTLRPDTRGSEGVVGNDRDAAERFRPLTERPRETSSPMQLDKTAADQLPADLAAEIGEDQLRKYF